VDDERQRPVSGFSVVGISDLSVLQCFEMVG